MFQLCDWPKNLISTYQNMSYTRHRIVAKPVFLYGCPPNDGWKFLRNIGVEHRINCLRCLPTHLWLYPNLITKDSEAWLISVESMNMPAQNIAFHEKCPMQTELIDRKPFLYILSNGDHDPFWPQIQSQARYPCKLAIYKVSLRSAYPNFKLLTGNP